MTLEEFISQNEYKVMHLEHPDFTTLCVKHSKHILADNQTWTETFDIVDVKAKEEGKGAFKRLISYLESQQLGKLVYVESVMNKRLVGWLLRNNFTPCGYGIGYDSFYKNLNSSNS